MKEARNFGAGPGVIGVTLGMICVVYTMGNSLSDIRHLNSEGVTFLVLGLLFSMLFGARAGVKIKQEKYAAMWSGVMSAVYTTLCTILVGVVIVTIGDPHFSLEKLLSSWLFAIIMSFFLGGIPMIIIGCLFGWGLKRILNPKKEAS